MDKLPELFHLIYYEVMDEIENSAFNKRARLFLNVQGICAYYGYTKMLEHLTTFHSWNECEIKPNEPCYVSRIHDTSTIEDVQFIVPAYLAIRRQNAPILDDLMRRGWSIHHPVRVYYRRAYVTQDFIYDDGIDYMLELLCIKSGYNLPSLFKTLFTGTHTNFNPHFYKITKRLFGEENINDSVSIPRRLLRFLTHEPALNNALTVFTTVMMFADSKIFDASDALNGNIDVSPSRLTALLRGLEVNDLEIGRTFDQDCCLAICLGILQQINDMGFKTNKGVQDLLLHLTLRILTQTRWLANFVRQPADALADYFTHMQETVVIGPEAVKFVQFTLPELARRHEHKLMDDVQSP